MKKISLLLTALLLVTFMVFALGSSTEENTTQGTGVAEQGKDAVDGQLGDYSVIIDSCRLAKDYEGKDVVIVKYIFSNISDDDPAAFFIEIDDQVYQAGIGLNTALFVEDDANYSADNQTKEIKKGASIEVEVAYELNDSTTDIEVEVQELISFDDTKITKTFSIAG